MVSNHMAIPRENIAITLVSNWHFLTLIKTHKLQMNGKQMLCLRKGNLDEHLAVFHSFQYTQKNHIIHCPNVNNFGRELLSSCMMLGNYTPGCKATLLGSSSLMLPSVWLCILLFPSSLHQCDHCLIIFLLWEGWREGFNFVCHNSL